ncbi:PP2C family protein-serine/threonine phosphatase [Streptomyces sp. NPDC002990]
MSDHGAGMRRILTALLSGSHLISFAEIPDEVRRQAAQAGLDDVLIYLADLQQYVLRLVTGRGLDAREGAPAGLGELNIDGTVAGRAFQQTQTLPHHPAGDGVVWWVPVLDGTERLGVLRVSTARADDGLREDLELLASVVAMLVVGKRDSSDAHARLVRTERMNVAAEMQWHLMPPMAYADASVVIGAALEPAYQVGGDAFDYARAGDVLHLAVFDAMGHDTSAGVSANLAVATCRNERRHGAGLVEASVAIEQRLMEQFGRFRYVTGILADLDVTTGILSWVNRGHLPPLVIRDGRWITQLKCPPSHPMGTDLGLEITVCREQLQPGDHLVLYTDGITEARNAAGHEFGLDGFTDFLIRHHADGLSLPETLRRLVHGILEHHRGRLSDDATVLLTQWLGPGNHRKDAGAIAGLSH